jgi:hypothetical protein
MTLPQVSIRTVRPYSGLVSRNGLVRDTYIGVLSIRVNVCADSPSRSNACNTVPNQAETSGLSDSPLLMNSSHPDCRRIAHSDTMDSRQVCRAQKNTACDIGWAWMGSHHDGQIT